MEIVFITTGGTIDKVYFDARSAFEVGESVVEHVLRRAEVAFPIRQSALMRKDSLDLTDADRMAIRSAIEEVEAPYVVITHGTDTMVETAKALAGIRGKTVVLTGSLSPARFQQSDAEFNIGLAVGAVQSLPPGVYVAMNGTIFDPSEVVKNRERNRFEATGGVLTQGDSDA
jgi:L-asparaginase